MTEEEKQADIDSESVELYAASKDGQAKKKIQVLGIDQSYDWRKDILNGGEFAVQNLRISQIGTNLGDLIPRTQFLYLDQNLISHWT